MLEQVSNYFITRTGAEIYAAPENSETTVVEAVAAPEATDYTDGSDYVTAPLSAASTEDIPFNRTRKLKYLYASNHSLTGFFDDGTVSECEACTLCEASVASLATTQPSWLYEQDGSGIAMFKHKDDMDAIGIPFDRQHPQKEWAIVDFKQIQEIPDCQ